MMLVFIDLINMVIVLFALEGNETTGSTVVQFAMVSMFLMEITLRQIAQAVSG
jgi:hypothetical protein